MKNLIALTIALTFSLTFSTDVRGQCPTMPDGWVCLSQSAANKAAENARTIPALENQIKVQGEALIEKDKIADSIKQTAQQNEADLRAELNRLLVEVGRLTGKATELEANQNRQLAIIELLAKKVGKRCAPLSILCI